MKKIVLFILFAVSLMDAQEQVLTLNESLELGLDHSRQVSMKEMDYKIADAKLRQTSTLLLPKLSFQGSYARLSDVPAFEINMPQLPKPITVFTPVLNNFQFQFQLQQPLFTGFKLSSMVDAAEWNRKAVEEEYNEEKNKAALHIHKAFWNFYRADKILRLVNDNYKSLKQHYEDAEAFFREGLITKNEVLKIAVELSSAELKLIEAKNGLKVSQAAFNKTVGLPITANTGISAAPPVITKPPNDYNEFIKSAQQRRGEINALEYRINAGREQTDIAASDFYPTVMIFSHFYYAQPNQRIFPPEEKFDDSWDVGISLQWDVWDWGRRSAATEEAVLQLEKMRDGLSELRENIELQVYRNFLTVDAAYHKVSVTQLAVEQAEEQYRIVTDKFQVQLATATELTDAETSLMKAKTDQETALVEYRLAFTELEQSAGLVIY